MPAQRAIASQMLFKNKSSNQVDETEGERRNITFELTRRRESKHPSPHQASCERRSRRSRPTICYAAALITISHG